MFKNFIEIIIDLLAILVSKKYNYNFKQDKLRLITLYQSHYELIKDLYKDAYYWHGTGRFHYKHKGSSKYDAGFSDELIDVLKSIISNDGLKPHYDFWTKLTTVSLTKNN